MLYGTIHSVVHLHYSAVGAMGDGRVLKVWYGVEQSDTPPFHFGALSVNLKISKRKREKKYKKSTSL